MPLESHVQHILKEKKSRSDAEVQITLSKENFFRILESHVYLSEGEANR